MENMEKIIKELIEAQKLTHKELIKINNSLSALVKYKKEEKSYNTDLGNILSELKKITNKIK